MSQIENLYKIFQKHPRVITDSRQIEDGCLFFALKGPNFNGNAYAAQALDNGAAYAIIDEDEYQSDQRFILVENVLETLQKLARHHRRQFDIPFIAITGSNGKTTTKELLSTVLSSQYPTHFTKGNFNNHIGVPLTLLGMPEGTEIAIVEMGANHLDEISALCAIAEPTHGLITNIGKAHLEGFGGLEGVKKGKSELYKFLKKSNGMVFINRDEEYLVDLAKDNKLKVFYEQSETPDANSRVLETKLVADSPFIVAAFKDDGMWYIINTNLTGGYNFNNVMTAISLGRYFRVPAPKIKEALEAYLPANNRSQLLEQDSNTFLMDAYNANPDSMLRALDNFANAKGKSKIAIIGDMLELGEYSAEEHKSILQHALNQSDIQMTITVGDEFGKVEVESGKRLHFKDVNELKEWFGSKGITESFILLKGSRAIRLEQILKSD